MFIFVSFLLFFLLFLLLLSSSGSRTQKRLKVYTGYSEPQKERIPWRELARERLSRIGKIPLAQKLDQTLAQAGIEKSGGEFLLQSFLIAIALPLLALPFFPDRHLLLVVLFALGLSVPRVSITYRISQRQNAFALQLGDSLNLMSNSLKAGYSFLQAMEMVAREMNPPISGEFAQVVREVSLGATVEEALENLGNRVQNDDLKLVLLAINIQRQVGGNLSEIFDKVSATIRERLRIKGEIKTLTAQGRLSSIIILLLPPALALFMSVANPQYMQLLFKHPLGQLMLLIGIAGQVLGILLIRRIIAIDV